MTNRWTPYAKGIDVSHWQPVVDWQMVKAGGISWAWAKCSEGTGYTDTMFWQHCQGAYDVDIPFGAYHFFRANYYLQFGLNEAKWPAPENDLQLQRVIKSIINKKIYFLVIDNENTSDADPVWIAQCVGIFCSRLRHWMNTHAPYNTMPLLIYMNEPMWKAAEPQYSWMAGDQTVQGLIIARYPYTRTQVKLDWSEMWESHMPADNAMIPTLCRSKWWGWQFSGDKFILPGIYNNEYRNPSPADLNMFNGTEAELYSEIHFTPKGGIIPPPPPPIEPPVKYCAHCGSAWTPDSRGNCGSCGAPPIYDTELLERVSHLELMLVELQGESDNLHIADQEQNELLSDIVDWKNVELQAENDELHLINQEQNERIAEIEDWITSFGDIE